MPYRFIDVDMGLIFLNATSFGTLAMAWFSDNLNSWGGFVVMMSVAYLNYRKAEALRVNKTDKNKDEQ